MSILNLVLEFQPTANTAVKRGLFLVVAALSERIVGLGPIVSRFLNKMDFTALRAKLLRARHMFLSCNPAGGVRLCFPQLITFLIIPLVAHVF